MIHHRFSNFLKGKYIALQIKVWEPLPHEILFFLHRETKTLRKTSSTGFLIQGKKLNSHIKLKKPNKNSSHTMAAMKKLQTNLTPDVGR